MSDSGDNGKYKWTPESTSLLVSVWSDRQVQKQLEYAPKPQLIWESVARYMKKKGYNVSGKQCRSRMKQVLVCYREAKRAGTRAGVEQYYESIDRVLKSKRLEENHGNGIDTVDTAVHVKSPPKDVKTNKNLQMRHKIQEPIQSVYRTEALSPTWISGRENEYPDSPESNETIIARPRGVFSPTKDVAINTTEHLTQLAGKSVQCNSCSVEEPACANYKHNLRTNWLYGEVPYQNSVQNVQNQIIQDTMQQYQNLQQNRLWSQQNILANELGMHQNLHNFRQSLAAQTAAPVQTNGMPLQNTNFEGIIQQPNQFQQNVPISNRAVPQEARKIVFGQNLAATYKQYQDTFNCVPRSVNPRQTGSLSPDYSPDVSQNLNDAFCQTAKSEGKSRNLNETFNQPAQGPNRGLFPNSEVSVITNNATCNDDSMLIDMLLDSPIPSDNDNKTKDVAVNVDEMPHVPFRRKKAQKLEQLVLNALNSQNEVVNKILSAQNDMVTKFLDIDRDRQNRLENRLDDLLKVVHATVLNKTPETESDIPPPPPGPRITSLEPPPRPGTIPPKLDLVPPKPCRVPCTVPSSNIELINQNPVSTRPGVVSPIMSPTKKPGAIWTKLGPVSQSPFVKAQQRLGIQSTSGDTRTQSSAERRIAREILRMPMDVSTLIFETSKLIQMERLLEEKIENARREMKMGQMLSARRKLFTQREPAPAMTLTAAFLETERRFSQENLEPYKGVKRMSMRESEKDDLLSGQGASYDRLRRLNIQPDYLVSDPCDTSTPAKQQLGVNNNNNDDLSTVPKQSIQQLARLVMNSARWKDAAQVQQPRNGGYNTQSNVQKVENGTAINCNDINAAAQRNALECMLQDNDVEKDVRIQPSNGRQNRYSGYSNEDKFQYVQSGGNGIPPKPKYPMGFTTAMMGREMPKEKQYVEFSKNIGFSDNIIPERQQHNVRFMDEALGDLHRMYIEKIAAAHQEQNDSLPYVPGSSATLPPQIRQMIEKYIHDVLPQKKLRDKDKDTDSDNDEEFLDTTATMPTSIIPRRGSLTSSGTASTETAQSLKFIKSANNNCVIS